MSVQASPKLYFEDVHEGDALPPLTTAPVSHTQLVRYSGASGDFNPLHTDPDFGQRVGIGGIIAHGMLIMGFAGRALSDYLGDPTALTGFGVRFLGMTRIGDVITVSGTIRRTYTEEGTGLTCIAGDIVAVDQNGDTKLSGTFSAALPSRS